MTGRSDSSNKKIPAIGVLTIVALALLVIYVGPNKVKMSIAREISNAGAKEPAEVYSVLFPGQADSCVQIINFKDQVIPKIDCCIWMEVKLCTTELKRLAALKSYNKSQIIAAHSLAFLNQFDGRPAWWSPQSLGDTLTRYTIRFREDKEQTFFVGNTKDRIYVCDLAL